MTLEVARSQFLIGILFVPLLVMSFFQNILSYLGVSIPYRYSICSAHEEALLFYVDGEVSIPYRYSICSAQEGGSCG